MITKRVTAARDVVSLFDPALDQIDSKKVQLYAASRNIDDLGDLSALAEKPTIFRCLSLLTLFENSRAAFMEENDANAAWIIFAYHVETVKYFDDVLKRVKEVGSGFEHLDDSVREIFGPKLIEEIARVICEIPDKADTTPFFQPPTWRQAALQRMNYRALREAAVPSSEKDEDTENVQGPSSK